MSNVQEKFMTICALEAYKNKSFEEVRTEDYLKAYTTTGKPPLPCPQEPVTDMARAALHLPPLFQPYSVDSPPSSSSTPFSGLSTSTAETTARPKIMTAAELPAGQEFIAHTVDGESYQSISCANEFSFFSLEELRTYAYLRGQKAPPLTLKMDPFVQSVIPPSTTSNATPSSLDPPENMQNTAARPELADHSFEELRVYYLLAGREVNSAEIRAHLGQPAVAVPTPATAQLLPGATPTAGPSTLFGPTAPTIPPTPTPTTLSLLPSLTIQPKATPSFSFKF